MAVGRFFGGWLEQAGAVDASGRWGRWVDAQPGLAGAGSAAALGSTLRGGADVKRANDLLWSLVRVGCVDGGVDASAVTFVASLLVPGGERLARTLRSLGPDVDAVVAGQLWLHIREYPWQRRPEAVAKNILMDCRRAVLAEYGASTSRRAAPLPLDPPELTERLDQLAPALAADTVADLDLLNLLVWARGFGVLQASEAVLLWQLAMGSAAGQPGSRRPGGTGWGVTSMAANAAAAAVLHVAERTVRRRRDRAVAALRRACDDFPDRAGTPGMAAAITARPPAPAHAGDHR